MTPPKSAIREFQRASAKDWDEGVSLDELLVRVNRVASKLLPAGEAADLRINPTLIPRTFRHYVTQGCIDPGQREGRRSVYGYRHFLQALLVRRLLAEGVAAARMPGLIGDSGTPELERMFLHGVEMVMRPGGGEEAEARPNPYQEVLNACAEKSVSGWLRVTLGEGIEIHLSDKRPKMTPGQRRQMLKRIEELVKQL